MTNTDETRPTSRKDRPRNPAARNSQYMIAPAEAGVPIETLVDRLNRMAGIEIVRTYAARGTVCPPIAVVLVADENAAALRRSAGGSLLIEPDSPLRAASFVRPSPRSRAMSAMSALGPGVTFTIEVLGESGRPVERAEVQIVGEQWMTQGLTGKDGKIRLSLYGELPETVTELLVKPRSDCWGLWQRRPQLQADATNTITLKELSPRDGDDPGWGGKAMRFDRLPDECRGAGIKIALVDSGVSTSHRQLAKVDHGIDLRTGKTPSWMQDVIGHGTPCAGIMSAAPDGAHGIRGHVPEAELHVCKLPPDARSSEVVAALDYCLQHGIDLACLGFGCQRGSAIVEQRIMAAKQQGVAIIAAAGNLAGPVQFPACSPHVMAIGAIGLAGSFPPDSPQAAHAEASERLAGGLFLPSFSSRGQELDLCAPGVAVVTCQAPDGYAACDGTSLAAAHVAALAALILAHHGDFRSDFAGRDFRRVERLFQVLKDTAQPIGHPWQTGAGLPDAARALGVGSQPWALEAPLAAGLEEMRSAVRRVELVHAGADEATAAFEPPRGPAAVTRLPLNPLPMTGVAGAGVEANVHALKAAMKRAGLAAGR
jgi:subtilisin